MRQVGWKTEDMEVVLHPGAAFFPVMTTVPGTHLTTGQGYELRFEVGAVWPGTVVNIGDRDAIRWSKTAAEVDALIAQVTSSRERGVEFWYTDGPGMSVPYWSGRVIIQR